MNIKDIGKNLFGTVPATFKNQPPSTLARLSLVIGVLTLTACATTGPANPQEAIKQRGEARWQALVERDFDKAYTYMTPGFRAVVTPASYRGRFGAAAAWLGGEVAAVDCPEATKCLAKVRLDFKPLLAGRGGDKFSTYVDETWLFEGGQWWIFEPIKP